MVEPIVLELKNPVDVSERIVAGSEGCTIPEGGCAASLPMSGVRCGDIFKADGASFKVLRIEWLPATTDTASGRAFLLESLENSPAGRYSFSVSRKGYVLAWITMSDKGAAGKRVDESGPLVGELVGEQLDLAHTMGFVIPDDTNVLRGLLTDLALVQGVDLILTTGGTGVAPRDVTPEGTLAVIDKRLPGFERAMTAASMSKTPHGAISRAVAGTIGQSLVVNMPGSPKAVRECLEPLLPTFKHTLEKLQGDPSDCANLHA